MTTRSIETEAPGVLARTDDAEHQAWAAARNRRLWRRRASDQARYSGSAGMAARPGTGVSMELVVMCMLSRFPARAADGR